MSAKPMKPTPDRVYAAWARGGYDGCIGVIADRFGLTRAECTTIVVAEQERRRHAPKGSG